MRVVWDDEKAPEVVSIFESIMSKPEANNKTVLKMFKEEIEAHGFRYDKDIYHANGIGNNNRLTVVWGTEKELQQCCYFYFCYAIYSSKLLSVSIRNYNNEAISGSYTATEKGMIKES